LLKKVRYMASSPQTNASPPAMTPTATWLRRLLITLTLLAWFALAFVVVWLIGRVAQALLLLALGALLAYVVYPLVRLLERVMPRFLAVILVYLLVLGGPGILLYFVATTVIEQLNSLIHYVQSLINAPANGNSSESIRSSTFSRSLPEPISLVLQGHSSLHL
jgi:predicted PurR-regulated permease PerM